MHGFVCFCMLHLLRVQTSQAEVFIASMVPVRKWWAVQNQNMNQGGNLPENLIQQDTNSVAQMSQVHI